MLIETGVRHYIIVIRRWLWLILLIVALCTGATYLINATTRASYEASALIQVHDTETTNGSIFTDQALAQSYALLINQPDVLSAVAQKIPHITVGQLGSQVSDSPLNNTQIIQVRVTAKDPVLAANITNTVVDVFIKLQTDHATQQLKDVAVKLSTNLSTTKQTINTDQAQLLALQAANAPQERIAHQNDILNSDQLNYNALQTNYTQVQQQLLQVTNTLTVAQPATVPSTPSGPHTGTNTMIAAALSFLVMLAFVMLLDWMNTTIKTPDDVEHLAHLEPLGSIPFSKKKDDSEQRDLPIIDDNTIEQPFLTVSTNVGMYITGGQSILVTSIQSKAGTSTTAANLAISLARSGIRICLVDANIAHASLHTIFQHPNTYGFTTVLKDNALFQDGPTSMVSAWLNQYKSHIPNLWFLPSGPIPSQRTTFLPSPMLPLFLDCLLKQGSDGTSTGFVDLVIFDSAPLEVDANTVALASFTDTSILVIEAGKEQAARLQKAHSILKQLRSPLLGVVINRQKPKHLSYFYTQTYRQDAYLTDIPEISPELKRRTPSITSLPHTISNHERPTCTPLQMKPLVPSQKSELPISPTRGPNSSSLGIGYLSHTSRPSSDEYKG